MNENISLESARKKLKAKQESLEPYLPIRIIAETLEINSDSAQAIIKELVRLGKARKFSYGTGVKSRYRIL